MVSYVKSVCGWGIWLCKDATLVHYDAFKYYQRSNFKLAQSSEVGLLASAFEYFIWFRTPITGTDRKYATTKATKKALFTNISLAQVH